MSCSNCFNSCGGQITSAKCVKYVGPDIPALGICYGQDVDSTLNTILTKIQDISVGKGIDLSDLTIDCKFLSDMLGKEDQNLSNLMKILIEANCTLNDLYNDLAAKVDVSFVYDLSCITIDKENPSRDDIVQALIYQICTDKTTLDNIASDYVQGTQLNTLIQSYLDSISSGDETGVQWNTRMVPYVAYPYHGSVSNFDGTGAGYSDKGFASVYLCNGSNGTPDYRGRSPLGANQGVQGNTLPTETDPSSTDNSGYGIGLNSTKGSYVHKLTSAQNGAHTHTITDSGHFHYEFANEILSTLTSVTSTTQAAKAYQNTSSNDNEYYMAASSTEATQGKSSVAKTGVTINSSGSGTAHNNLHPVVGCLFIMFIP